MNTCSYCTRDTAVMSTAEGERVCMDCSTAAERDEQHERDELQARQDWQQAQRRWNERRWAALRTAAARRRQGQQRVD